MTEIDPNLIVDDDAAGDTGNSGPLSQERYELRGLLGSGGSGSVYKAWDRLLDKVVALKMMRPLADLSDDILRRETAIAQELTHPSIIRIYDVTKQLGCTCISMEFVDGPDLAELLRQRGTLSSREVIDVAVDVCDALAVAHSSRVIHCDIKPANLLITPNRVYVADFGISACSNVRLTGRAAEGSAHFMSPEQEQRQPVGSTTDFYSLGVVMFQCLTGRLPSGLERTCPNIRNFPRVFETNPRLAEIIVKCLQHDPTRRYQYAAELAADLNRCRRGPLGFGTRNDNTVRWAILFISALLTLVALYASRSMSDSAPKPLRIIALPFISDPSLTEISDGLYEYTCLSLRDLSNVSVWTSGSADQRNIPRPLALKADVILSGQISRVGSYFSLSLSGINPEKNVTVFSLEIGGNSVDDLEYKLWDRLMTEPLMASYTLHALRPKLFEGRDPVGYGFYIAGLTLFNRNRRSAEILGRSVDLMSAALARDHALLYLARRAEVQSQLYDLTKDKTWSEKAVSDGQRALYMDQNSEEALIAAAKAQLTKRNMAYAMALLHRAIQIRESARPHRLLGNLLAEEGLHLQAVEELKKAASLNPSDPNSVIKIGLVQLAIPNYPEAIESFRSVLQADPKNSLAKANLASAFLRAARFQEALPLLEELAQGDLQASTLSNLGMALYYAGNTQRSLAVFEKAAQLEPRSATFVGNLAHAYRWNHSTELANRTYNQAIALALRTGPSSLSAQSLADLGIYEAALGSQNDADKYTQNARELDPLDIDILYKACVTASILHLNSRVNELLSVLRDRGYPLAFAKNNPEFQSIYKSDLSKTALGLTISGLLQFPPVSPAAIR